MSMEEKKVIKKKKKKKGARTAVILALVLASGVGRADGIQLPVSQGYL